VIRDCNALTEREEKGDAAIWTELTSNLLVEGTDSWRRRVQSQAE